jgi:hypothetical protein
MSSYRIINDRRAFYSSSSNSIREFLLFSFSLSVVEKARKISTTQVDQNGIVYGSFSDSKAPWHWVRCWKILLIFLWLISVKNFSSHFKSLDAKCGWSWHHIRVLLVRIRSMTCVKSKNSCVRFRIQFSIQ